MKARISGPTVNGEEVEVGMETRKNGREGTVLYEIRSSGSKQVRPGKFVKFFFLICAG